MNSEANPQKKPRILLRLILVIALVGTVGGSLAYLKLEQFAELQAQGEIPPPPISVEVAVATPGQWQKRILAIGSLVASQGVDISSEVGGIVREIEFRSGQEVSAGQLLLQLDDQTELASLEARKAEYESADSQYQRLLKLKDQAFVNANDLDTQAGIVEVARSQIGVAESALAKKKISAPFAGKLGIREVDVGEYLAPGTAVVSLQSLDRLLLDFTLPESNYREIAVGQPIRFKVHTYPDEVFDASIVAWNPSLDESTRNITIRATVDNRDRRLAPGMFAEMEVTSSRVVDVLTLPETAIFYNIYGEAVYVLEKEEDAEADDETYRLAARQVDVEYRENGIAGINSGLKQGDLAVTAGQLKLYPSLKVVIVDGNDDLQASTVSAQ